MSRIRIDSIRAVARKDFQDAVRSWMFIGLSVFFFTLLVAITGLIAWVGDDLTTVEGAGMELLVWIVSETTRLIIPLIALLLGWKSIAGEREAGSIKVLLSLPHSRWDIVIGKLIGRSLVLSVSLIIGFVLAGVIVAFTFGDIDFVDYGGLLVVSMIYGIAYISLAVSLSAMTRSTTVAGAAMVGVFVLFYVIWNTLGAFYELLANRDVPFFEMIEYTYVMEFMGDEFVQEGLRPANWMLFLQNIDPGEAYARTLSLVTDVDLIQFQVAIEEAMFEGSIPFYLQDWFALIILLLWIIVPILFAGYAFERADL